MKLHPRKKATRLHTAAALPVDVGPLRSEAWWDEKRRAQMLREGNHWRVREQRRGPRRRAR